MKKNTKMLKKKFKNYSPKIKEECGVFGISNYNDASALTALGLHALQHRGQEGCGIVSFDEKKYYSEKRYGLVGDNYINSIAPRVEQLPFGEPTKATPDVDLANDGGVIEADEIAEAVAENAALESEFNMY